jgi:hypothetical protein
VGLAPANSRAEHAEASGATGDALLQCVRRADFRFLLPDPRPREVAILGEPAPGLVDALRALGARVTLPDARDAAAPGSAAPPELVLARGGSRGLVERAQALLRPGGHLYVEADRAGATALAAAARRAGLRDVVSHWHWPDFARALEIAPLDAPEALRLALSRRRSRRASRAKAWLAGGLARVGALQRFAPCVSVLARKPGAAEGVPGPGPLRFLETNRARLGLARRAGRAPLSYLLVTPRFRASRHVVFLALERGRPEPVLVAKLPRVPDAGALARETANLRRVAAGGTPSASVPRVLAFEACGAGDILVETALLGSALDAATVRRDFGPWGHAVVDWLAGLDRSAPGPDWFERQVEAPLDTLARLAALSPDEARAIENTRALAAHLRGAALPAVFEHGDLSPPNVLRLRAGGIGVLDWELADPHGLPAGDLFFFLTWAAWAREGAGTDEARSAALAHAFFGRDAWARPFVLDYARRLGLPAATLTPLFVLTWARTLARFVDRLEGSAGRFAPGSSEWLRQNRYYHVWRQSLARADELHGGDVG